MSADFRRTAMNETLKRLAPSALRGKELGPQARWALQYPLYQVWRRTLGRGKRLDRPIFMIGSPRSGTTIATRLFAAHPDVANLSEARAVWDPGLLQGRLPKSDVRTAHDATPEEVERLHSRFAFHQWLHHAKRFFNKSPFNSIRIDFVRAVFPDAVFVHVIRDGRAVAESMWRLREEFGMKFVKPPEGGDPRGPADPLEHAALDWVRIVSHVRATRDALDGRYHEFRYEDLCRDCRGVLGRAFSFAELPAGPAVIERFPERLESRNDKWRSRFTPEQIERVTALQQDLLLELGYQP
ncbi:MAG: sulfotransferase [Gemmatimonadota bacterium]